MCLISYKYETSNLQGMTTGSLVSIINNVTLVVLRMLKRGKEKTIDESEVEREGAKTKHK